MDKNPRPKFMSDLKELCRNFEREVNEVDKETRATLHHNRANSNLAADKWKDEVLGLKSEINSTLMTVEEEKNNLTSFLDTMNMELRRMLENTEKMQDYMAQYGYKPEKIDIEGMLDWQPTPAPEESQEDIEVAPAAASEFEDDNGKEREDTIQEAAMLPPKSPAIQRVEQAQACTKSPSIFDIGLSNYGMSMLLGKDLTKPQATSTKKQAPAINTSTFVKKPAAETPPPPSVASSFSNLVLDESKYESSPVLKMNSRPLRAVFDDSNVEITPGLARSKPTLLCTTQTVVTPELPTLTSDLQKTDSMSTVTASPMVSTSILHSRTLKDTPEMPELTTDIRKFTMDNVTKAVKSRPTPEFPELASFK